MNNEDSFYSLLYRDNSSPSALCAQEASKHRCEVAPHHVADTYSIDKFGINPTAI
jgi:hypothetical protein